MIPTSPENSKKAGIETTPLGEEVDEDDIGIVPRTRGSIKRERVGNEKALAQLVQDLIPLKVDKWEQLGLADDTIATLIDARKIKSHGARSRHARLIRSTLRSADWSLVRRRLDHLRAGYTLSSSEGEESSEAQLWTEQLLVQGDAGLARFMEKYPDADRKRLRQMVRASVRAPEAKRGKARLQLDRAVDIEVERASSENS